MNVQALKVDGLETVKLLEEDQGVGEIAERTFAIIAIEQVIMLGNVERGIRLEMLSENVKLLKVAVSFAMKKAIKR